MKEGRTGIQECVQGRDVYKTIVGDVVMGGDASDSEP
jgi:hypothetical protein